MTDQHTHTAYHDHVREAEPMPVDEQITDAMPRLGPDSLIWKFYGDFRVQLFGFQRLAGTENAVAELAQGVTDHSVIFGDFLGRALRTAPPVLKAVYSEDPYGWGRTVRDFHRGIKGQMPDGSRYHALNPELFYWAHATFLDQILYCTDTFVRRLSYEEKVQIFEESKVWYRHYGVSARSQPQTYDEFVAYWDSMLERFAPNRTLTYATGYIRKGVPAPSFVPPVIWSVLAAPLNLYIRTMIVGTLPPPLRAACQLDWDDRRERRFQRAAATLRALDPIISRMPIRLRYVPWAADGWRRVRNTRT
ncbi:oxygenase MpaB family protein [Nocardia sp. NPDC050713]|uniref:oxygenase MpaB family protein n=1 Tax=Nocardia sp. NPDC050713 TaxID=3154511 RepID=UPI0033E54A1F